ncbi:hypothetical protein AVEN_181116-1 [Araneus ventricosus]|uniref:Uncharacterized protein n=1 Tax=Araneus ventricosus TaxID=182803 RepID=A0A4Y2RF92_ARAVE|nr:hypothetical protein AVEN_227912-1 [Araneus ventricosus]GBN74106.1 hypothetical protein AVEN_204323-1 [Araneus ventricosus]GBN74190.1 hypothetical protein AVEN_231356-1 [Araneus ventricosus]GBN74257.1 hypothetical protein AVEN_181116-1 [Araneus ventricosus]
MLWACLLLLVTAACTAFPQRAHQNGKEVVAASRQGDPINAALIGFFSPPFIIAMSMGALAYTFEKFTKDMIQAASKKRRGYRRKKKKPTEAPPPPTNSRDMEREHRKLIEALARHG